MSAPTNLHRDLGRMEGKLDAVLSEMRSGLREAHTRLDRHEVDIQSLKDLRTEATGIAKAARWFWAAGLAVVGAASGYAGSGLHR